MNVNVTYDANTLATAPSDFFTAVNYVVSLFDTTFINNASINIEVGYGDFPYDGTQLTSYLGESQQNNIVSASYSQVTQALVNDSASGASTLPSSSPISGRLQVGSAQEKALGLIGTNGTLDGWVGIASDAELQQLDGNSWSFSATATPAANQYYLVGVIDHEFTEVMGRDSYLDTRGEYGVLDLYRYAAPGVRRTGTGDPAYFSIDNGSTNLDSFNDPRVAAGDLARLSVVVRSRQHRCRTELYRRHGPDARHDPRKRLGGEQFHPSRHRQRQRPVSREWGCRGRRRLHVHGLRSGRQSHRAGALHDLDRELDGAGRRCQRQSVGIDRQLGDDLDGFSVHRRSRQRPGRANVQRRRGPAARHAARQRRVGKLVHASRHR